MEDANMLLNVYKHPAVYSCLCFHLPSKRYHAAILSQRLYWRIVQLIYTDSKWGAALGLDKYLPFISNFWWK